MFQEDINLVKQIAREIAKEEIAKAMKELAEKEKPAAKEEPKKLLIEDAVSSKPVYGKKTT